MKNIIKRYIWVIAGVIIAAAVLVFAFLSGGNVEEAKKAASSASSVDSVSVSETTSIYQTSAAAETTESTVAISAAETTQALTSTNPNTSISTEPATTSVPKTTSAEKPASPKKTTEPNTKPANTTKPQQTKPTEAVKRCTISISCATLLNNMGKLDEDDRELVPSDGWILSPVTVNYEDDDSVFDLLKRECKARGIHMEFSTAPIYNTAYIEGIGNLFEFSAGSNSGWMYRVNGKFPNYGCSLYDVKSGDVIEWLYTCDLGHDIGGSNYSN